MNQAVNEWPSFFPDDTPPLDAAPAGGIAYRLVDTIPSKPIDFLSHCELNPRKNYDSKQIACGVSFHKNFADAKKTCKRYRALRQKRIAIGELQDCYGVMKETPSKISQSHLTVWFRSNANPHVTFAEEASP